MRPFLAALLGLALPLSACFASPPPPTVTLAEVEAHAGRVLLPLLRDGDALRLLAEPDHPFDPEAVAAYWGDFKLGYLPAERPCRRCDGAAVRVRQVRGAAIEVELLGLRPETVAPPRPTPASTGARYVRWAASPTS